MIRQIRSNAISVNPFNNQKQSTPNLNQKPRTQQITSKNLVSDKSADTLTSSITTFKHRTMPDVKIFGASSTTKGLYLDKYFNSCRRFSEKRNADKSSSPLNDNFILFKVSSDLGSIKNSVQAIDNDQISMFQSGKSNKDSLNQKTNMFCNSQIKLNSQQNNEEMNENNQIFKIQNKQFIQQIQELNNFKSTQNQDNFIHNSNQESFKLIQSQNYGKILTSIKQDENEQKLDLCDSIIQKHDSLQSIQNIKQFRIKIEKTIFLNQTQDQNPQIIKQENSLIIQQQNSQILEQQNSQIIQQQNSQILEQQNSQIFLDQQKDDLDEISLKQAKSEILRHQIAQQKFSNFKYIQSRLKIRILIFILIVILLIKIYTPLV